MYCTLVTRTLRANSFIFTTLRTSVRDLTVSVVGAGSEIGQNLALFLKLNQKIEKLKLYDEDESLPGTVRDLQHIPSGPLVMGFLSGQMAEAVKCSDLVAVVSRIPRLPCMTREQTFCANADMIAEVASTVAVYSPEAFIAVSTSPINAILPLFSTILNTHNAYNPSKVFGVTNIDTFRSRTFAAQMLHINPRHVNVPVVGGHSDDTIIPLFSRMMPINEFLDDCQIDCLTRNIRFAGEDVVNNKAGTDSSTIAMAWATYEFLDGLIDALRGHEVILPCYTANMSFDTGYFAGPTSIARFGITQTCCLDALSNYEEQQLDCAIAALKEDVSTGESYCPSTCE